MKSLLGEKQLSRQQAKEHKIRQLLLNSSSDSTLSSLVESVERALVDRPYPLRVFDQIHMRTIDLTLHLIILSEISRDKSIVFMGDSDGVALSLAYLGDQGLLPCPSKCLLCDFDERVLSHVDKISRYHNFSQIIDTRLYNVFDPLPESEYASYDLFHTNPPYGQFNGGNSIIAFVERSVAMVKLQGEGVIVLANDDRFSWTAPVLRNVTGYLVNKGVTPYRMMDRLHRYHLDDQPELESGLIWCRNIDPGKSISYKDKLPDAFRENFYGRESIEIPHFIQQIDDGHKLVY